jgi:hypothetical protein
MKTNTQSHKKNGKMNSIDDVMGHESSHFIHKREYKMKNREEKKKQL